MSWFNELGEVLNAVHNGIVAIDAEERVTGRNDFPQSKRGPGTWL